MENSNYNRDSSECSGRHNNRGLATEIDVKDLTRQVSDFGRLCLLKNLVKKAEQEIEEQTTFRWRVLGNSYHVNNLTGSSIGTTTNSPTGTSIRVQSDSGWFEGAYITTDTIL